MRDITKGQVNSGDIIFTHGCFLKTQKITSAVYLVTDIMSDSEPIKWELRSGSIKLMSLINLSEYQGQNTNIIDQINASLMSVVSLLDVSLIGGLISSMNHSILIREYINLRNDHVKNNLVNNLSLREDLLFVKENIKKESSDLFKRSELISSLASVNKLSVKDNYKRQVKDNGKGHLDSISEHLLSVGLDPMTKKIDSSSDAKDIHNVPEKVTQVISDFNNRGDKKYRKDLIMRILQENNSITIKDICSSMGPIGYSEKTVQRDLIEMLSTGDIKRTGQRRWSRYSLNALNVPVK